MHPKDIFFEGIKGVCHVGAWDGAEIETYYNNGVELIVWVEPISTVFSRLIKNTCSYNINQFWLPLCLSNENDIVLDPFIGTGTTAVVSKRNKRNYIGFDIQPEYIKDARKRIDETINPLSF
jgi:hypothetical protein